MTPIHRVYEYNAKVTPFRSTPAAGPALVSEIAIIDLSKRLQFVEGSGVLAGRDKSPRIFVVGAGPPVRGRGSSATKRANCE
jgi:hypothetical protein